jgi:transforming growth factor-beta-induced protein
MLVTTLRKLTPLTLPLALFACGGDSDPDPTPTAPGNIVAVASANPDFSTLVSAVQAAGLVETLSGPGPFTVFAPTNAAFEALPAGTLDALLADIPTLTKILTYHVVAGRVPASAVTSLERATSVQGADISIRVVGGEVFVNDAKVVVTDVAASNGVIHVIDAVITPPTIADIAAANPDFSTLVSALDAAGLVETLSGAGPFTVFAPTNAAFEKIPQADLQALLADVPALTGVLTYHVVAGDVRAAEVVGLRAADTVQGTSLIISAGADVKVNDAKVVVTDIVAGNGVIHVIDTVITPGTVADLVGYAPELTTLATAVAAADLGGTLAGAGPFTVFAPSNAAFEALPAGTLEALLADVPALTNVLTYHVVADDLTSAEVVALTSATSVQGQAIPIVVNAQGATIGGAGLLQADIKGTNGVIHLIDRVLLPPSQ